MQPFKRGDVVRVLRDQDGYIGRTGIVRKDQCGPHVMVDFNDGSFRMVHIKDAIRVEK